MDSLVTPTADTATQPGPNSAPKVALPAPTAKRLATARITGDLRRVPIGTLVPSPLNPRKLFDAESLDSLKLSIAASGILQPLLARPHPKKDGKLEIIFGERRYRAAARAEQEKLLSSEFTVPVIVHDCDDHEFVLLAAAENLSRKDLHPLEEGAYYKALLDQNYTGEEINRQLGVPLRTIRRRCKLLRASADVQKAYRENKITQQQVEAMVVADEPAQKKLLADAKRGISADQLRRTATRALMAADEVDFDLALYAGEFVEDEDGKRYFADQDRSAKLQQAAIDARVKALEQKWPWVKVLDSRKQYVNTYGYRLAPKGDADAGATVELEPGKKMKVEEGVWTPEIAQKKSRGVEVASRIATVKKANNGHARLLTNEQIFAVKRAKTQAMRRGLIDLPKAGLVLAIIGIAFGGETGISATMLGKRNFGPEKDAFAIKMRPEDIERAKKRLTPIAAYSGSKDAEAFTFLMKQEIPALLELLAALMCPLIGAHVHNNGAGFGPEDSAFAVAVATTVGADKHLPLYWAPDADYFMSYPNKARLDALALGLSVETRIAIRAMNFPTMKKGDLAKALAKAPAGTWTPQRFPELAFCADRKAMMKAADAKPAAAKRGETTVMIRKPANAKKLTAKKTPKAIHAAKAKPKAKAVAIPKKRAA